MTIDDIKKFQKNYSSIEDTAANIISYIKSKYPGVLRFGRFASYDSIEVWADGIIVNYYDYGYDIKEVDSINVPFEAFTDGGMIPWCDGYAGPILKSMEEKKEKAKTAEEERERKEYERLKNKFENK